MMHKVWLGVIDYGREAWAYSQLFLKGKNVDHGIKLQDKFLDSWMKSDVFGVMEDSGLDSRPKWKLLGPRGFMP
jgi:hypothetical protein